MKNACKWAQQYGPLIGRLLLANLFIVSGFKKIGGFAGTVGYMAAKMPSLDPNLIKLMLVVTIAVELGGGLMVLIGWQARWAATAIFLFLIPTTLIFHPFWAVAAGKQMEMIQFMKNLCIMGGMLYVMAFGAGPLSVDNRKRA